MNSPDIDKLNRALNYFNNGKLDKAEQLCSRIIKRHHTQPDALNILGVIALRKKQYHRAISRLEKAIQVRPEEYLYHYNIGLAYTKSSRLEEAIISFRNVIQLNPAFKVVYIDLCNALTEAGDFDSALDSGNTAIKYNASNSKAYNNLAVVYEAIGDFESASNHYSKAVELSKNNPVFLKNLGNIYLSTGNTASAKKCYKKAIELSPSFGEPYLQLSHIKKYSHSDDAFIKTVNTKLNDKTINDLDRCDLHFALGKMLDDCKDYDEAFEQFHKANRLANKRYSFKPERFELYISGLIQYFSTDFMQKHESLADTDAKPIFIIGMPRSGTSLVEQILASHHKVYGAGELLYFGQLEKRLPRLLHSSSTYPECLNLLDSDNARLFAQKYLQYIKNIPHDADRVTDKMPENFLRIGLIKLLFKNAKFIYCRRNPMDTGLSIYQQRFAGSIHWGYDLYNIGAYYAQHVRIMEHWSNLFPAAILAVEYEDLVQNQEDITRQIIEFLDLAWDHNCLHFFKTERHVHTASDVQVKKPIYTSSIARWRCYDKHLEPFNKGLSEYTS